MALDDLSLDRPAPPPVPYTPTPEPESRSLARWNVVGVAGVIAGGLLTYLWMSRTPSTPAAPPSATAPEAAASPSNRPVRQPMNLPSLAESDGFIRELVSTLSKNPNLARLLATPSLVRGVTVGVMQVGDGRTPVDWLRVLRPRTRLQLTDLASGVPTPASYARWNDVAEAISSVSPAEAAQLYVNVKPLIDEAYIELGQPEGDFDRAIVRAIQMLKDTPEPATAPVLLRRPGYVEYEDGAMQSLRPVQKQLLLLGPDTRRRLMAWLDEFARALEL
jgi:hypothetical protein